MLPWQPSCMQRYTKSYFFFTLLAGATSLGTFPYSINVLSTKRCWFSLTLVSSPYVYSPWLCIRSFQIVCKNKWKQKHGRSQRNLEDLASYRELILQSFKEVENEMYKVLSEWKFDNLKEKFKSKEICRLWIYMYSIVEFLY